MRSGIVGFCRGAAAVAVTAAVAVGCVARSGCGMKAEPFGTTGLGEKAHLYTVEGAGGIRLVFSDFGGRLVECHVPGRDGRTADVTLGWNSAEEYVKYGFSMGTLIGRYGNRIADGRFKLDGRTWQLPINETSPAPRHCNLHGGPQGWDTRVWKTEPFTDGDVKGLRLSYVSKDGEMGFPGTVHVKVTYSVLPDNVWRVEYEAVTDKPTVINPTHHSYWNLAGEASGNVLGQELKIYADKYTKTDAGLIPTADHPVKGTGFDFTVSRPIGAMAAWMAAQPDLKAMDNWYDHNFVLRGKIGVLKPAAEMYDPASGRLLEIWTTEPCMQMYGSQNMTEALPSKTPGRNLCRYAGVALETQHYPDSPNRPDFPSTVLRPGETFRSVTEYRFKTR
jgi:aldose 1-epimerase